MRQQEGGRCLGPALISLSLGLLTHSWDRYRRQCGLFPLACPMGSLGEHDACHVSCLPHCHTMHTMPHFKTTPLPAPARHSWGARRPLLTGMEGNGTQIKQMFSIPLLLAVHQQVSKRAGRSYLITLAPATEIGSQSSCSQFSSKDPSRLLPHLGDRATQRTLRELIPFSRPSLACLYLSPPICLTLCQTGPLKSIRQSHRRRQSEATKVHQRARNQIPVKVKRHRA